jgi:6-phosphogluconolactonase (cycloisomerase 2 family)
MSAALHAEHGMHHVETKAARRRARGSGAWLDPDRQEGPHAHQVLTDPDSRYVFGVDFGTDRILIWSLDPATGKLYRERAFGRLRSRRL